MSTILYRLTIFSFSISFFVSSVQFVQRPGKKIKFVRAWLLLFPKKKKKKGKTNPNVSFSFLLSFHPVENSSVEETGRRAVRGTERNKKKKNGKKEKREKKSNRLEVTWNMRSCSRKKYRPTIVPVKCPRNPLATGFPLAAFRSLLRREPRDFSSSGGTDVINDLRIGNPWNENREHHARIPAATCACDRLRICEEEGGGI